jgi:hypothetical protein
VVAFAEKDLIFPHKKLKPLQYGPYTIMKVVGENYFELSIPLSLACTQYLMWSFFDHIFHPYWTLQRWLSIWPLQNSILIALSRL